jgi:hypothetical protein
LQIDIAVGIAVRFRLGRLGVDILGDCLFPIAEFVVGGFTLVVLDDRGVGSISRQGKIRRFNGKLRSFDDLGTFFENGVLHELLLDHIGELELVQLKQVHHLHQAWCQKLLLLNLEVQFVFEKSHKREFLLLRLSPE